MIATGHADSALLTTPAVSRKELAGTIDVMLTHVMHAVKTDGNPVVIIFEDSTGRTASFIISEENADRIEFALWRGRHDLTTLRELMIRRLERGHFNADAHAITASWQPNSNGNGNGHTHGQSIDAFIAVDARERSVIFTFNVRTTVRLSLQDTIQRLGMNSCDSRSVVIDLRGVETLDFRTIAEIQMLASMRHAPLRTVVICGNESVAHVIGHFGVQCQLIRSANGHGRH